MTSPILEAIAARRSIRAYTPEQISEEQLQALIAAAEQAPSARNQQPWHLTAVQDAELIARIDRSAHAQMLQAMEGKAPAAFSDPEHSFFFHAPTVFFLSTDMRGEKLYARHDCGCVAENICLAAYALGLGSVILGMPREAFAGPEGEEFRRLLAFPEGYDYMVAIAVGHPAATKDAHRVREGLVTVIR